MKAEETNEPVGEGIASAAGERAKSYVDAGVNAVNAVSGKARQLGQSADSCVRDNAWMALGAAAGIGVLIGFFLRVRRDS